MWFVVLYYQLAINTITQLRRKKQAAKFRCHSAAVTIFTRQIPLPVGVCQTSQDIDK
jgi:hypothetical protein